MHHLEPNTDYQILTINVAIPREIGEAAMADAINETLRNANERDVTFADWEISGFETIGLKDGETVRTTDDDPQEGDLFGRRLRQVDQS